MKVFYYLKTCDTCKKLLNLILPFEDIVLREIKSNPLDEKEIEDLHELTKSYEALFNKRAKLYKTHQLKDKDLSEQDYKKWLIEHYTFLKRPVLVVNDKIHIGNNQKSLASFIEAFMS